MDIQEADLFRALGNPDGVGAGFICAGANMTVGAELQGQHMGARCLSRFTNDPDVFETGVYAVGDRAGVFGQTGVRGPDLGFLSVVPGSGVFGTSDVTPGVAGTSLTSAGVVGQSGDAPPLGPTAGVVGISQQLPGVSGTSTASTGVAANSETGFGVFAHSNTGTGIEGSSATATGIFGFSGDFASGTTLGTPAGVIGTSAKNPGVVGTTDASFGVVGQVGAGSAAGFRLFPAAVLASSAANLGLVAISDKHFPVLAISGQGGALIPTLSAIWGTSFDNIGVAGSSVKTYGVYGLSSERDGVHGESFADVAPGTPAANIPSGVFGRSLTNGIGVLGVASPGGGAAVGGIGAPNAIAGYFEGNLVVTGQITAGVKDAMVPFPDGSKRLLHCMESPEHWFEDFGAGRLKAGRAVVKLDGDFAKVIKTGTYLVFLTPEGDCGGLYVKSKSSTSFEVRELQGGTANVAFSYRIVAKRKDVVAKRFAKIDTAELVHIGAKMRRPATPRKIPPQIAKLFGAKAGR